ncbi:MULTISPECIES: RluA family pseudouridine synthase [unclassified Janthinobacterium]|uniref:RluA family pseudouridine synthase n=1 Tax=unclassified Janthinobacterium TaxID=2610881 RepID=UPI0008848D16|nr:MULTISPECIES: RluA family pseudouridine synthase [unclassified Janthinobacterium]SDA83993.1 tRNA pseudouridine32 synthase / 23S rRNA pseudouridine746 synthase [Janthinobacterium sp. 551a]SFB65173.1 tRNA pseudouridine32 synthase / 23S rRNA pseudouridine746 synthase [Janthinobacterium sp. 344]
MAKRHAAAPLPMRDGVAPSYLWLPEGQWPGMLAFLVERYPQIGAAQWLDRMARGEVVDGDGAVLGPDSAYRRGMRIFYYRELERETPIPFQEAILYQDEHLVVVDKPHFLPMTPGGRFVQETLLTRLKKSLDCAELTPIHRLDRETAGVVIFSRQIASRGAYQSLFQRREVRKTYEALAPALAAREFPFTYRSRMVEGGQFFLMREEDGEPNSETVIDVIERRGALNLYRLHPHTGRKHQLRVHLAALGIPIVNDAFYPVALPCKEDDMSQPLQLLARAIDFTDPLTGEPRHFESRRSL